MTQHLSNLKKELSRLKNTKYAEGARRFFKTGAGHYAEKDVFIGISVPVCRSIAKEYSDLSLSDTRSLLHSPIHEERLIALLILVIQYRTNEKGIFNFYLKETKYINNWDLVDLSAYQIVGAYSLKTSDVILKKLSHSKNLWKKRIAIVATFAFIKGGKSKQTFDITKTLLHDSHDLIHKACGWMLREVGKRISEKELCGFLDRHKSEMPRTMLRYAIERLPESKRKKYLIK